MTKKTILTSEDYMCMTIASKTPLCNNCLTHLATL